MKKIILLSILILTISAIYSQKIETDKIDEFTNSHIKETSWEKIEIGYFRFRKINDTFYFNFKYSNLNVFSVSEGDKLILKLKDGSILDLMNSQYEISSIGAGAIGFLVSGAMGVNIYYPITKSQLKILEEINVEKYRLYTSLGYTDTEMKTKNSEKLKKSAELILN
ncbi:MAG: hypothetical protein Q8S44_01180 [Flavobacteriaceae bacterium]|nr:hypothetical protein [Flavobacteriaceae bacterium]